ncbi:MAG: hypothetical protein ACHP84_02650 [Caulobacterales bacterium]
MAPLPAPQANLDDIQALRAGGIAPLRVGSFVPGPGQPTFMDKSIMVRAGEQAAPGGSFSRHLGDTIEAQLEAAGKFDPNSAQVVSGVITKTHLDSSMPTGRAELAATFTLTRDGRTVFQKTIDDQSTWNSDFVGAVAIPDAFNHYEGLFTQIAGELFADPEFRTAARAQ